jgi:hypothetical protein
MYSVPTSIVDLRSNPYYTTSQAARHLATCKSENHWLLQVRGVNHYPTENPMTKFGRMAAAGVGLISTTVAIHIALLMRSPKPDSARRSDASSAFHVPPCDVSLIPIQNRKPLVKHSFNIEIELTNSHFEKCQCRLTVDGAAFTIKPEDETVELVANSPPRSVRFSVLPAEPGEQTINIRYGLAGEVSETELNFIVYQYPFIPPSVSLWFPILGFLFGSMLTVPWWIERRAKRKMEATANQKRGSKTKK